MTVDEFVLFVESKQPPAPEPRLRAFEAAIGGPLPADYRAFLVATNGGSLGGKLWFIGPTPEGLKADAGVHHVGGFRREQWFSLERSREVYQGLDLRIPRELVWVMDDPFGNAICLGVRGRYCGKVYFWDHEEEPEPETWDGAIETAGNLMLLANSFTEFVGGLVPTESRDL